MVTPVGPGAGAGAGAGAGTGMGVEEKDEHKMAGTSRYVQEGCFFFVLVGWFLHLIVIILALPHLTPLFYSAPRFFAHPHFTLPLLTSYITPCPLHLFIPQPQEALSSLFHQQALSPGPRPGSRWLPAGRHPHTPSTHLPPLQFYQR